MKESIVIAIQNIGFKILEENGSIIRAEADSFGNGCFNITIQISHKTLSMELIERFGRTNIFLCQKFIDADYIIELLQGNYPFQEFIIENDGSYEKLFRERMLTSDLLSPGETWATCLNNCVNASGAGVTIMLNKIYYCIISRSAITTPHFSKCRFIDMISFHSSF